ncbi:MAG: Gfo/Idh/MocA family oxidoreductase [Armatimonadetes bacterium]|nr:Gfo/Idh/MocA family oxidoreductase [Armatimonadota bacterium]MDE2206524.1 Gfo/Idh/MocA family oxidoreductase [Armatimonadota bacterium]
MTRESERAAPKVARRQAILGAAGTFGGLWMSTLPASAKSTQANNRLNIGVVGVGDRGGDNLAAVKSENIVALCDVDDTFLAPAAKEFPAARLYRDFRRMMEQRDIDAVVVSTPDHMHAPVTMAALKSGRHVYCEKPLAHTVYEARQVTDEARQRGLTTQLGTQIHAGDNYRRVVEVIRSGAIGVVTDVHVWADRIWTGTGRPTDRPPVPSTLVWPLWLGVAPLRPYNPVYLPATWRGWWDFGGGTLADMACHHVDLSNWALELGPPISVETEGPTLLAENTPAWLIAHYQFAATRVNPAISLTWYNGGKRPPQFATGELPAWGDGTLFVGETGMLLADYGRYVLLPADQFVGYVPPAPSIPASIGHHREWIEACKNHGQPRPLCNFDYGGPLSEKVLLANVAYRSGKKLEWDSASLCARGCPEADAFIRPHYRRF